MKTTMKFILAIAIMLPVAQTQTISRQTKGALISTSICFGFMAALAGINEIIAFKQRKKAGVTQAQVNKTRAAENERFAKLEQEITQADVARHATEAGVATEQQRKEYAALKKQKRNFWKGCTQLSSTGDRIGMYSVCLVTALVSGAFSYMSTL